MIPFGRRFTEHGEEDVNRAERITDNPIEMASAFNGFLEGYKRVVARGGFDVPKSCREARDEWLLQSNNTARFVEEKIELTHDLGDCLGDFKTFYEIIYNGWCQGADIEPKHRKCNSTFQEALENFGLVVKKAGGGLKKVYGGRLIRAAEEVLG